MSKNDQSLAKKIREQYTEKQTTELEALRELDKKVKRPANVFAYIFGSISAIVMGGGMSLTMTDIANIIGFSGDKIVYGTVIGVVGLLLALLNYPLYAEILKTRKQKYSDEILELSEKIMNK